MIMHVVRPCVALFAVYSALALAPAPRNTQDPPVNPDALIQAALDKRVKDYRALHQKLEGTLPPLPREATPLQMEQHRRALAVLVQKARSRAQRGDIYPPEARALIRRYLARALAGTDGAKLKSAILEESPGPIRLGVNGRYPHDAPRSTVPPTILEVLPKLPEELEYRFLGDRLVLLDVHADLVVDYIENALPR